MKSMHQKTPKASVIPLLYHSEFFLEIFLGLLYSTHLIFHPKRLNRKILTFKQKIKPHLKTITVRKKSCGNDEKK